jgi:hypothetical protein
MAREIPEVVRAAAGLAATVLDEARKLPEALPGLPVRIIGLAMQHAMKIQQQYAGFVARGDELFTGLRGENEPGLATFDDDEPAPTPAGFRDSAFDRAADTEPTSAGVDLITDEEVAELAEAVVVEAAIEDLAAQVEVGQQSLEDFAAEAPGTEEILDELAIDELLDEAPPVEETPPTALPAAKAAKPPKPAKAAKAPKPAKRAKAPKGPKGAPDAAVTEDAAAPETALLESGDAPTAADTLDAEPTADVATTVDVLTPAGEVTVTDEGAAAPATAEPAPVAPATTEDAATAADDAATPAAAAPAAPTDESEGGSDVSGAQAAGTAPVEGYDGFSIAQLRGRLRGYQPTTVRDLIAYEEATRARAPYLKMLRNRLERVATETS